MDEARENLSTRVRDLTAIMDEIKETQFLETQALDMGSAVSYNQMVLMAVLKAEPLFLIGISICLATS